MRCARRTSYHPTGARGTNQHPGGGQPDLDGWEDFPTCPRAPGERGSPIFGDSPAGGWSAASIRPPTEVLAGLHRNPWRILHLAGHGEHDFPLQARRKPAIHPAAEPQTVSGMVIGRDTFLTPGDVEQMRWVPSWSSSACHLGMRGTDKGALAANLGMQFIKMGVRAVVAAGWAVDDAAAALFANTFYRLMLAGEAFGEAVRAAREEVWLLPRGQHLGCLPVLWRPVPHPAARTTAPRPQARRFHCPTELGVELDNLTRALRSSAGDDADRARIAAASGSIPESARERGSRDADLRRARLRLGRGARPVWRSIEQLDRAIRAAKGDCSLRALEQLANFRARPRCRRSLAAHRRGAVAGHRAGAEAREEPGGKRHRRARAQLCERAPTVERLTCSAARTSAARLPSPLARQPAWRRFDAAPKPTEASEKGGGSQDAYLFTNWRAWLLACSALTLAHPEAAASRAGRGAPRLRTSLQEPDRRPDSWISASLVRPRPRAAARVQPAQPARRAGALTKAMPPRRPRRAPRSPGRILATYRDASPAAPARERASLVENLDALLVLLEGGRLTLGGRRLRPKPRAV